MQFDRLELLMKQQGKTKKHMGEIVGKGGYYIKDCKTKGIQVPETIVRIWADDLGTTYEYLMGMDEPHRVVVDIEASSTDFAQSSKFNELYQQIAKKETAEADLQELQRFMEYLAKKGRIM